MLKCSWQCYTGFRYTTSWWDLHFQSSLHDEELLPSLMLWFSLKLLPSFRGLPDSHSTFTHITPNALKPRLLSQITDLQDQMPVDYLHQDTGRTQNSRTVMTIFPNISSLGALLSVSNSLAGSEIQALIILSLASWTRSQKTTQDYLWCFWNIFTSFCPTASNLQSLLLLFRVIPSASKLVSSAFPFPLKGIQCARCCHQFHLKYRHHHVITSLLKNVRWLPSDFKYVQTVHPSIQRLWPFLVCLSGPFLITGLSNYTVSWTRHNLLYFHYPTYVHPLFLNICQEPNQRQPFHEVLLNNLEQMQSLHPRKT